MGSVFSRSPSPDDTSFQEKKTKKQNQNQTESKNKSRNKTKLRIKSKAKYEKEKENEHDTPTPDTLNKTESLQTKAESMQEVLPNIYMGPSSVAQDLAALQKNEISHILAIGWDLKAHFPDQFEYLLINKVEDRPGFFLLPYFPQAFEFMDRCLVGNDGTITTTNNNNNNSGSSSSNGKKIKNNNRIFVHCHKGLSRSASIIIAYEMKQHQRSFESVYNDVRKSRSFIMPNIGFQVQLQAFHRGCFSLDMSKYATLDIYQKISETLPDMLNVIILCQNKFAEDKASEVNDQELFEITMYFHQVDMLNRSGNLKAEKDVATLRQAVQRLRTIQVKYIAIDSSIKRFDNLFRLDSNGNPLPPSPLPAKKSTKVLLLSDKDKGLNMEKKNLNLNLNYL